jgi:hypothetical protein
MIATLVQVLLLTAQVSTISTTTLVLRDGTRIEVSGPIQIDRGRLIFTKPDGKLYSLPVDELDEEATRNAPIVVKPADDDEASDEPARLGDVVKLQGTPEEQERLLREIEKNHSGTPGDPPTATKTAAAKKGGAQTASAGTPAGSEVDVKSNAKDETYWRDRSRDYRENLLRAQEELELLLKRQHQLEEQILNFVSLGYKGNQFTYQTSELERIKQQIERARLEIVRAQRALDQFLDDARKADVLPGWLR